MGIQWRLPNSTINFGSILYGKDEIITFRHVLGFVSRRTSVEVCSVCVIWNAIYRLPGI